MNEGPATPAPRARSPWLIISAVVGGVALLGVLLLQVQQLDRLNATLFTTSDLRMVEMHRQETEYLQLREQWARALDASTEQDLRALTLRYDIWVGRMALLREDTAMRRVVVSDSAALDTLLQGAERFTAEADPVLGGSLPAPLRRARLAALYPALVALGDVTHELPLAAAHQATHEQTTRNLMLTRFTRITLMLTGCLALMVLAFAGLSLRQMRQLRNRNESLQALTADLHAAGRAAEASNQAKSNFLANMSHEIRTPFQGLLGMLSMLRDTGLDARKIDYLRTATESADHLLAVLNDILDMSQLEAGRLQLNPAPVVLRALLQDVDALMRPQATARHLALHVDAHPAVPERVRLDATRVKQVLFNLLSNAIKFSPQGSVALELRTQAAEGGADQLVFTVTDTGIGMDSATLDRLFTRYERGGIQGSAGGAHGTGLGLEISRNLARLMGGDLQAISRPGRGSRFTFTMPLDLAPEPERLLPSRDLDASHTQKLRLLVAEDHVVNRQVLSALLDSMGHQATFVANGEEALAAVQQQRFDVVLMDLHMPGLDGIEATRRIRALANRAAATVPIVALTADAFTDTRERCLVAGINSFLSKPVGRDKLAALLRQLFGNSAEPDAGADPLPARGELNDPGAVPLIDSVAVGRVLQALQPEVYARVLDAYFEQAPDTLLRLRKAVRDAQPLDLRVHAHATRGAALNLGLAALAETAEGLQNGAAHLPAHEIARRVQRFADQLVATRVAAEQAGLLPKVTAAPFVSRAPR